jgi:hypothetical protein
LFAGVSVIAFVVCLERSTGQTSEIDSYEVAVGAQSKTEALNFIKAFRSSHLVDDLIQSLSPEVAQQVCADLNGGGPAGARKACEALPKAVAVQPVVPPAEIAPFILCRLGRRARLFFSSYLTKRKRSEPSRPLIKRALRVLMDRAVNQMKREAINSADEAAGRVEVDRFNVWPTTVWADQELLNLLEVSGLNRTV